MAATVEIIYESGALQLDDVNYTRTRICRVVWPLSDGIRHEAHLFAVPDGAQFTAGVAAGSITLPLYGSEWGGTEGGGAGLSWHPIASPIPASSLKAQAFSAKKTATNVFIVEIQYSTRPQAWQWTRRWEFGNSTEMQYFDLDAIETAPGTTPEGEQGVAYFHTLHPGGVPTDGSAIQDMLIKGEHGVGSQVIAPQLIKTYSALWYVDEIAWSGLEQQIEEETGTSNSRTVSGHFTFLDQWIFLGMVAEERRRDVLSGAGGVKLVLDTTLKFLFNRNKHREYYFEQEPGTEGGEFRPKFASDGKPIRRSYRVYPRRDWSWLPFGATT